jgi:RNA polymerase sigma factor (sigma-70 family)
MSGSQMDAEDALSRAMLKAFEKLPAHANKIVSLRAWLMSFTHNVCMDIHRERARVGLHVANIESSEAALVGTETNIESPDCAVARLEQRARLLWALKNLAPRLRDPFILRFLHDMNYEVIAARLGLTPANVRKRIQQARERLRETLNKSA